MNATMSEFLEAFANVKAFTFSQWCVSGLVPTYTERCECWRCRKARGEMPDETLAERVSNMATARFRKHLHEWLEERERIRAGCGVSDAGEGVASSKR